MSSGDGFLTRWSRRKLEPEQNPLPAAELPAPSIAPEPPPSEMALSEDEIALLPRIEDLTPESDITAFLRNGVPDLLKKAALRRMWALDPAIRDYVGDARDYAWNWNVPGDVPGNGPLLPGDDMTARIERMFSNRADADEPEATTEAISAAEQPTGPASPPHTMEVDEPDAPDLDSGKSDVAGVEVVHAELSLAESAEADPDPRPTEPVPARQAATPLRRHSTAIPKLELF